MTDQDLSDEGWVSGFGRFRLVAGFHGYDPKKDEFQAYFHPTTVYAKDDNVRKFLMVQSHWPPGRVMLSFNCEIPRKALFSPN